MRMGLYYSGGYDWSYNGVVLKNLATAVLAAPQDRGTSTTSLLRSAN